VIGVAAAIPAAPMVVRNSLRFMGALYSLPESVQE
jgi:hypothetical protein